MKKALSFKRVFKEGVRHKDSSLCLWIAPGDTPVSRLGISIPSKVIPGAANRNRIKRLIREIFRKHKSGFSGVYDIIIRPQKAHISLLEYNNMQGNLLKLFTQAGVIK